MGLELGLEAITARPRGFESGRAATERAEWRRHPCPRLPRMASSSEWGAVRLLPGAGGRPLHSSDSVPASGYRRVAADPAGLGVAVAHGGEAVEAGLGVAGQGGVHPPH